jgi:hypothetical protein
MTTKTFTLGDVLSITTSRLLSPRHVDGLYDILNYMTGDNLFTHQLPRAANECKPHLLEQFPQLKDVDVSGVNSQNWESWLAEQIAKYGDEFAVAPLPKHAHEFIDPLSELAEHVHPNKIIPIKI